MRTAPRLRLGTSKSHSPFQPQAAEWPYAVSTCVPVVFFVVSPGTSTEVMEPSLCGLKHVEALRSCKRLPTPNPFRARSLIQPSSSFSTAFVRAALAGLSTALVQSNCEDETWFSPLEFIHLHLWLSLTLFELIRVEDHLSCDALECFNIQRYGIKWKSAKPAFSQLRLHS